MGGYVPCGLGIADEMRGATTGADAGGRATARLGWWCFDAGGRGRWRGWFGGVILGQHAADLAQDDCGVAGACPGHGPDDIDDTCPHLVNARFLIFESCRVDPHKLRRQQAAGDTFACKIRCFADLTADLRVIEFGSVWHAIPRSMGHGPSGIERGGSAAAAPLDPIGRLIFGCEHDREDADRQTLIGGVG